MKRKDLMNLRAKSLSELGKMLSEKKVGLSQFNANFKTGSEKNLKKGSMTRREIAQILTIIREKQISEKSEKEATSKQ